MRIRNPATSALFAMLLIGSGPATASLIGDTIDITTSATGTTTITPLGTTQSVTVVDPANEFSFCIGPNTDNCSTSGMSGTVNVGDSTVQFRFDGITDQATGSFEIVLGDLDWVGVLGEIVAVDLLFTDIDQDFDFRFSATDFTSNSITFTGTPSDFGDYFGFAIGGIGGTSALFQVEATHVPEPATLALFGIGLAGLVLTRKKKAKA